MLGSKMAWSLDGTCCFCNLEVINVKDYFDSELFFVLIQFF